MYIWGGVVYISMRWFSFFSSRAFSLCLSSLPNAYNHTHTYILYISLRRNHVKEEVCVSFVRVCVCVCIAKRTHSQSICFRYPTKQFYILYQGFWRWFDLFTVVFLLIAILLSNLYALYCRLRFKTFSVYIIYNTEFVRFGTTTTSSTTTTTTTFNKCWIIIHVNTLKINPFSYEYYRYQSMPMPYNNT